jgi:diguanylate cyclase (GGDEF)-like protein
LNGQCCGVGVIGRKRIVHKEVVIAGARQPAEIDQVVGQIERLMAADSAIALPTNPAPTAAAPVETTAAVAPSTTVPSSTTEARAANEATPPAAIDEPGEPPASSGPMVLVAVGVSLLVAAIAVVALRRKRSAPQGERNDPAPVSNHPARAPAAQSGYEDLLDLSRRMTTALDPAEVAQLAVNEAMRLANAQGAGFLVAEAGSLRFTTSTVGAQWSKDAFATSRLGRVLETGQPMLATLDADPALGQPAAIAAIPVIAAGGVVGVIVVARPASAPFDRNDLDALQPLGPITGSAMFAANAHSSAVSQADVDGLTQLKNRRRLDRDLADIPRGQTIGFAMIDVDHFKNFNDTNGHQAGDVALQTVAQCLAANVRAQDVVYRYGGEEFSVVLIGATESEAMVVMERVRAAVESAHIPGGEHQPGGRVTISVGLVISVPVDSETAALAGAADEALYRAKHDGRNRVVIAR